MAYYSSIAWHNKPRFFLREYITSLLIRELWIQGKNTLIQINSEDFFVVFAHKHKILTAAGPVYDVQYF
jgi:hypothetical protein